MLLNIKLAKRLFSFKIFILFLKIILFLLILRTKNRYNYIQLKFFLLLKKLKAKF